MGSHLMSEPVSGATTTVNAAIDIVISAARTVTAAISEVEQAVKAADDASQSDGDRILLNHFGDAFAVAQAVLRLARTSLDATRHELTQGEYTSHDVAEDLACALPAIRTLAELCRPRGGYSTQVEETLAAIAEKTGSAQITMLHHRRPAKLPPWLS